MHEGINLADRVGVEPTFQALETCSSHEQRSVILAARLGVEPSFDG